MRTITSSPHVHSGASTRNIMLSVALALTPACLWGIYAFGFRALLVLCISTGSAIVTEYLLGKLSHENTIWDGSALVTGLLVGMNMPSTIPLFIPVLASFFAIAVVKWTFGGLGANWANPAIAGRIFVTFSFSSAMSRFASPTMFKNAELVSSATPLGLVKSSLASGQSGLSSIEILRNASYPATAFAERLSAATGLNAYDIDAFFGNISGCIGEVSALLLILGGIYLLCRKIITWHIPASYIATFSVLTWIFGAMPYGLGAFKGEVLSSVLRGGFLLGVLFMATDMVTTPITHKGQIIFGIGCGFFTFLFRTFGSLPEATSIAILLMNIVTPTINRFCVPVLFGRVKPVKEVRK